jgi:hypothetical protein
MLIVVLLSLKGSAALAAFAMSKSKAITKINCTDGAIDSEGQLRRKTGKTQPGRY